jgi:hypothetical protein
MGYDVWIYGDMAVKPDGFDGALAALRDRASQEDGEPCDESFEDLVQRFSGEHFDAKKSKAGVWLVSPYEDGHRNEDEAEELFDIIAPFLEDGVLEFKGEDGEEWTWTFEGGNMKVDHASQIWDGDRHKIEAFDKVIAVLYPKGKLRKKFPKNTLDKVETIIRKSGFGPLAGLADLDAIAKAADA